MRALFHDMNVFVYLSHTLCIPSSHSLVGKVELVVDKCRVDGSRVLVAEVEVGDETGSVSLRARDEQIGLLHQLSSDSGAIVLRNCTMELYQGKHLRLAVSKWGKMCVYPVRQLLSHLILLHYSKCLISHHFAFLIRTALTALRIHQEGLTTNLISLLLTSTWLQQASPQVQR